MEKEIWLYNMVFHANLCKKLTKKTNKSKNSILSQTVRDT